MALARIMPTVSGAAGAQLNYASLVASGVHVPEFIEQGMDADFVFDLPGDVSFRSRTSPFEISRVGKSVSLQDNSAGKYAQIGAATLSGLLTPTMDQREMTYAGLFNYRAPDPTSAFQVLAGSAAGSSVDGGEFLFLTTGRSVSLNVRGYSGNISVTLANLVAQGLVPESVATFLFIAVTSRRTGNGDETTHTLFVGAPTPLTAAQTNTKVIGARALAIGNAYNPTANYDAMPVRVGRFVSGAGPRTVSQLAGMYQRAKVIGARRGLAVL